MCWNSMCMCFTAQAVCMKITANIGLKKMKKNKKNVLGQFSFTRSHQYQSTI